MKENLDIRSYAYIRWKKGKSPSEIFNDLSCTFPDDSPSQSTFFRWVEAMKRDNFTLQKGVSSGRPRETRTPEIIARVDNLITVNPRS